MAQTIVMPQAGNTVESCIIVSWTVKIGDQIEPNAVVCEAETDKSTIDVEAGVSGTVLDILWEEGDEVPVKEPILIVGQAGEDLAKAREELGIGASSESKTAANENEIAANENENTANVTEKTSTENATVQGINLGTATAQADNKNPASPRARAAARAGAVNLANVTPTGPKGRIIERDVLAAKEKGTGLSAAAKASGAFTSPIPGTGLGGRQTLEDLQNINIGQDMNLSDSGSAEHGATQTFAASFEDDYPGKFTDTPLKGIRKIISERMIHSLASSAQLTLNTSARADGLLKLRKRFKNSDPSLGVTEITLGDLVSYATVLTLKEFSQLNANLENQILRTFESVHLGLAVDTPRGLLVPTIRNANRMGIREFSSVSKNLAAQCKTGKINPELLSGATFTVSNLGAYGIETFTPVLNVPQTGILGVGTITNHPVETEDQKIRIEKRIGLSLTIDHQVIDGAQGAKFLKTLVGRLENIDLTVMS